MLLHSTSSNTVAVSWNSFWFSTKLFSPLLSIWNVFQSACEALTTCLRSDAKQKELNRDAEYNRTKQPDERRRYDWSDVVRSVEVFVIKVV